MLGNETWNKMYFGVAKAKAKAITNKQNAYTVVKILILESFPLGNMWTGAALK